MRHWLVRKKPVPGWCARILASVLLCGLSLVGEADCRPGAKVGSGRSAEMAADVVLNPNLFGDHRNSSRLDVAGTLAGETAWSSPAGDLERRRSPVHLGLRGNQLIVHYADLVEARNRADGAVLWRRDQDSDCAVDLKPDYIETVWHAGFHRRLSYDGQPSEEEERLRGVQKGSRLLLLLPRGPERLYAYQERPMPVSGPEARTWEPGFGFARFLPETEVTVWAFRRTGFLQGVVVSSDTSIVHLATAATLYTLQTNAANLDQVRELSFEGIRAVSLDDEGHPVLVRQAGGATVVEGLDGQGSAIWKTEIPGMADVRQPAAIGPGGAIYLLAGDTVYRILPGRMDWAFSLPGYAAEACMTVLADGSVLVATGSLLLQISAAGESMQRVAFDTPLTCRPIMDENGRVYVGSANWIRCLE